MKKAKLTVLVYAESQEDGGGYWAKVAELPGCFTSGETLDEIKENVPDAIEAYVESIVLKGDAVPELAVTRFDVGVDIESIVAATKAEATR